MDEFAKLTELTTDPLAELLKEAVELAAGPVSSRSATSDRTRSPLSSRVTARL